MHSKQWHITSACIQYNFICEGSFVGRLKEKGVPALVNCMLKHSLELSFYIAMPATIPFCFSLNSKFCQDNTAVTTPNTVTVATHSATKEAVVAVKTPEEGETVISTD